MELRNRAFSHVQESNMSIDRKSSAIFLAHMLKLLNSFFDH